MGRNSKLFERKVVFIIFFVLLCVFLYNRNIYVVTAYCNCKKCINSRKYRDKRFASNAKTYFGGAAASKSIPFKTRIELIPLNQRDRAAVDKHFKGRRNFTIEDRGFLIRGRKIDIFIPQRLGGHKAALKWGRRRMRIKMYKKE